MLIIYRLQRFWTTLLVVVVAIPIILGVWYGIRTLLHTPSLHITIQQPHNSHQFNPDQPITLVFSHPVDKNIIASTLRLTPDHKYNVDWNKNNTTLVITPSTPWQPETHYTITIPQTRHIASNVIMDNDWRLQFTVVPNLQVQTLIPANQSDNVALNTVAVMRFSQPMVAAQQRLQPITTNLLQITPPISGTLIWLDQSTLLFRPNRWQADRNYTITTTPLLRDLQARQLATPLVWKFRTIATRIDTTVPANNSQNIAITTPITIRITGIIDVNLLRDSIALTPATAINIDITTNDDNSINATITPQPQWQIGTTYQIQIGGAATTIAAQQIRFTTTPALRLIARSPGDGQVLAPNQDIRFVFNTDLDTDTISDAINIIPPPLSPAQITSNGRDIRLTGSWAANSQPIITIDQSLRSSTGITLSTTITSQLLIGTNRPHVNLPGTRGGVVSITPRTGIVVDNQNINRLQLQLYALPPAVLVRVLSMDDLTLQQLDPNRYNLPLIDTQTITNPQTLQRFDLPLAIWQSPLSRYLLAIGRGNNNSADVRIIRILPSTLNVIPLSGQIIAGTISTSSSTPATITLFQEGQLIEQAQSNAQGIWISRPYPQAKKLVLLDDSKPPDAVVVNTTASTIHSTSLHIISSQTSTTLGADIDVTLARTTTLSSPQTMIALCDSTETQLYSQTVSFAPNQATTQARITIPTHIAHGIYTICGDDIVNPPAIIVHPPITTQLVIRQRNVTTASYGGTITDNASQPIANAIVYWQQHTRTGTTTSNVNGEFQINTIIDAPLTLVALAGGQSTKIIVPPAPQRTLLITTPQQWVQTGKYSTVYMQINDPNKQNLVRPIKLTVQNSKGYVAIRRTVTSDDNGYIALDLAIPRGQWLISATADELIQQRPLIVGNLPNTPILVPESPILYRDSVMRFFYGTSTDPTILVAQADVNGVRADWALLQNGIISATIPVSTTALTIAAQTSTEPLRQYTAAVNTPQCIVTSIMHSPVYHKQIPLNITTTPNSTVAIRVQRPFDGHVVAWYPAQPSDATGKIALSIADDNQSTQFIVDILQNSPTCSQHEQLIVPIVHPQQLTIRAPSNVRIDDEIVIAITLQDTIPFTQSTLIITPTGMTLRDPLVENSIISDINGTNTRYIHTKITTIQPSLTLSSSRGAYIHWQPTVTMPPPFTSNDGFMLQGKTIINTDDSRPLFDVIHERSELFEALITEPYDTHNPSQLAYRFWLSDDPSERTYILSQLMYSQHAGGGWSWGNTSIPDIVITTDVVSALASAGVPVARYQPSITYLQQQVNNPQYPATIQALIVHALTQTDWHDPAVFTRLCANPTALGNEGLAALLLVLPHDYAYAIPALLNELLSRSYRTPRGLTWDNDPATAGLHTSDSVNALILQASLRTSVSTSITNQIQSLLLSRRGSNGWSDIITNARMWALRDTLFAGLDGQQQTTILDQHGYLSQNRAVSPGVLLNKDVTITSNAPVLVGITRSQSTPIDSDTVRILRDYTINGLPLTANTPLTVGDTIDVELNIISFVPIPYLTIQEPLPTIGEVTSLTAPRDSQTRIENALLSIQITLPAPTIIKCYYRIKISNAGQISVSPTIARDVAGTWYAQSQPQSIYVSAP